MSLINEMLNELEKNKKGGASANKEALISINPVIKKQTGIFSWKIAYFSIVIILVIIIVSIGWHYRLQIKTNLVKTIALIKKQTTATTKTPTIQKIPTIKLQNIVLEQKNDQTSLDFVLTAATQYHIDHTSEQQMVITFSNTTLSGNLPVNLENSFIIALNTKQDKNNTTVTLTLLPGTKTDELKLIDTPLPPHLHLVFSNPQLTSTNKMLKTPTPISPEQEMNYRYQEIIDLLSQNKISEATTNLRMFIGDFPNNLKAREMLVSLLIKEGQLQKAHEILMVGLNKAPGYHPFIKLEAYILMKQNKSNKAINLLQKHVSTTNDTDYLSLLAALYQQQKYFINAAEIYTLLTKVQPQKTLWWIGLGVALEGANKTNAAKEAYQNAYNNADVSADLMAFLRDKLTK